MSEKSIIENLERAEAAMNARLAKTLALYAPLIPAEGQSQASAAVVYRVMVSDGIAKTFHNRDKAIAHATALSEVDTVWIEPSRS